MVIIIAVAFIFITYSRLISRQFLTIHHHYLRWRLRRRRRYAPSSSAGNMDSPPYPFHPSENAFHLFSPYGLDETVIRTIPLAIYNRKSFVIDCAVCLLEFEDNDYVRTLPTCSHSFHVDCIDIWLRSHANCPLCRAGIYRPESPFTPLMAARIRPSLDDVVVESLVLETLTETEIPPENDVTAAGEISQEASPRMEDRFNGRDFLLKRSYSFGFERNLGSERLVMEAATTSPWRYRRGIGGGGGGGSGSFWNKRSSPFSSLMKPRVFSFRHYTGIKSPFFRRRTGGPRLSSGGGGASSRRRNFFPSPIFGSRSSVGSGGVYSSSRLRSGDPEALLSPDRYNRRWR